MDTVVLLRSGNKLSPKKLSVCQQPTVYIEACDKSIDS